MVPPLHRSAASYPVFPPRLMLTTLPATPATCGALQRPRGFLGDDRDTITDLQRRMETAAEAMAFEEARRLRDQISLMRGGASREEAEQADEGPQVE